MVYLSCHRSAEKFALVGHSTGCQNSVHFVKQGDVQMVKKTKVIALQAPVSDRESAMLEPSYKENIKQARLLQDNGKGDEMMPRSSFWAPITAARFLSLQDAGGEDDFFSSDLTDNELKERLGHIGGWGRANGSRLLAAFSGQDEYVPSHVDKKVLLERVCGAMNHSNRDSDHVPVATAIMLDTGNHNLSAMKGDGARFVEEVARMLDEAA